MSKQNRDLVTVTIFEEYNESNSVVKGYYQTVKVKFLPLIK